MGSTSQTFFPEEIFATLTSHSFKKTWKRRTGRHPGGKFRVRRHKCFKEDQRNPVMLISCRSRNTLVSFFFGVGHEANAASMFRSFYQFNFYGFTLKIYSTPGSKTLQTHTGQSQHSIFKKKNQLNTSFSLSYCCIIQVLKDNKRVVHKNKYINKIIKDYPVNCRINDEV